MNPQKGISTFFAILVVGTIAIIGFTVFYSYQYIWAPEEEITETKIEKKEEISVPESWETYKNEKYGFEVKHPPEEETSSLSESENELNFAYFFPERSEDAVAINTFLIKAEENNSNLSLIEWVRENEACDIDLSSHKEITLDGVEGIRIKGPAVCPPGAGGIVHKVYVSKGSKIYTIELIEEIIRGRTEELIENQKKTFEQVLSSFGFIEEKKESSSEEDSVPDNWKTYRNEEYGFEMRYPDKFFSTKPKTKTIECNYDNFNNECPFIPIEGFTGSKEDAFRQKFAVKPDPERITLNDVDFCRQEGGGAGLGTTIVTYNYTTIRGEKCFVISFKVGYPNCSNYLPVTSKEMQEAYNKCKLDNEVTKPETIDKIISTFEFIE